MHGHYLAYCHRNDCGWLCCNDDVVREVSFQEVLHCEPYMLFYRAVEESFVCWNEVVYALCNTLEAGFQLIRETRE